MNRSTLDYLMRKVDSRRGGRDYEDMRDSRDYEDGRRGRRGRDRRDYEDSRRGNRDRRDYEDGRRGNRDRRDYEDGRRGNVDFEGSMDFDDREDRDYAEPPILSKADMHHWKHIMENEDGTRGAHYDMQQVMAIANKIGLRFDEHDFDEKEFCLAVNMMYSDYCKVVNKYVAPEKELAFFAELAKAFLCDTDGPGGAEKLALYFHCIVDA